MRVLWVQYKIGLEAELEYRVGSLLWIINQWVGVLFIMFLWFFVAKSTRDFPMTPTQIVTYFLLSVPVSRLTQSWSWENLEEAIRTGDFTRTLLWPCPFWKSQLGANLAGQTVRLLTLLPVLIIVYVWLHDEIQLSLDWFRFVYFLLAIAFGLILRFTYENFMGITTFWLLDVHGFAAVVGYLTSLLTGSLIPLTVMPPALASAAKLLPFRFFVSFPLEIILGQVNAPQIWAGFATGFFWLSLLIFLFRPFFRRGVRVYEAVGI